MAVLLGSTRPREFTPPLLANARGLPVRTRGRELIRFARDIGEPFWPWQDELALRGLELGEDGRYRFRIMLVIVARQNGKTRFLRVLALWRLFDQAAKLVVAAAQDRARAFEVWEEALELIQGHEVLAPRLAKVWRRTNAEYFRVADLAGKPAGRYMIKAATKSSGRGPSADLVEMDELREQTDWDGWSALSKTIMAGEDRQLWGFSNAGDRKAAVLRHLRKVALAGSDPAIGICGWSAPDGAALDDRRGWSAANPSLGRPGGVTEGAIRTAMHSDPPEIFRTEVLCQFIDAANTAIDADGWRDTADAPLDDRRRDWIAGVGVEDGQDLVALVLAAVLPDDGRIRVHPARVWQSAPGLPAVEAARRELPGLLAEIRPRAVGWFPTGPAKPLASILRPRGTAGKRYREIKGTHVSEACMGLAEAVKARRVLHPGDALLTDQVTGAEKLLEGTEGVAWVFARAGGSCAMAYAAAGAVYVAEQMGARRALRVVLPSNVAGNPAA